MSKESVCWDQQRALKTTRTAHTKALRWGPVRVGQSRKGWVTGVWDGGVGRQRISWNFPNNHNSYCYLLYSRWNGKPLEGFKQKSDKMHVLKRFLWKLFGKWPVGGKSRSQLLFKPETMGSLGWAYSVGDREKWEKLSICLEKQHTGLADKLNARGEKKREIKK